VRLFLVLLYCSIIRGDREFMGVGPVTVEQVREAQEYLKLGMSLHEKKNFSEAIEEFKKTALIHPFDENHLPELTKKLKAGGYKKQQESIAYMGCATVHLQHLVQELSDDQQEEVPVDEQFITIFKDWE
jgi:hypothetical protein